METLVTYLLRGVLLLPFAILSGLFVAVRALVTRIGRGTTDGHG